ncbi:MAG: PLP-dependent aminotransferase family protein [Myxococcales bacterium]|nr:PLP-dependent aminotransferase family protein [Myxococcales bacterium]
MPLARALANLDQEEGPLYQALAARLARLIRDGELASGQRLPTHRDLAGQLDIARGTVRRAYDELERRGLVESTVGRGTFVRQSPIEFGPSPADSAKRGVIDLTVNLGSAGAAGTTAAHLRHIADETYAEALEAYIDAARDERLQRAGQRWLAQQGVDVEPASVSLCVGSQHALLIAMLATTRAGDSVAVDALTYPGMRQLAAALDRRLVPVQRDEGGLMPDDLDRVCRRHQPTLLYCMPTLHNPTGTTLSQARRAEIAAVAQRRELWLLEDESLRLLWQGPEPALATLLPERTLYVAGLSKVVVAGPRMAFLSAPAPLRAAVRDALWATVITAPSISAVLASRLVESGDAFEIAAATRRALVARARRVRPTVEQLGATVVDGSPYVWLPLGERDADAVAAEALRRGVSVLTARPFAVSPPEPQALRLTISAPIDDASLDRAFEVLFEIIGGERASDAASLRLL